MSFDEEQVLRILHEKDVVVGHLQNHFRDLLGGSQGLLKSEKGREYLKHGVCRRINILHRSIQKIFEIFPPNRTALLNWDELAEVEINLHAFIVNLNGLFDNLAWVFVHEKGLDELIKNRNRVGLFISHTQEHLPLRFRAYMTSEKMKKWHARYAKDYRDSLAHRIPPYVPPATVDPADEARLLLLEAEQRRAVLNGDFHLADLKQKEMDALKSVCTFFVHSHSERVTTPYLHPQIVCDGSTAVDVLKRARNCFKKGAT